MSLKNYSITAASNTSASPNGAPEGMAMSGVNDTMRQIMADIRTLASPDTIAAAATTDIGTKDSTFLTLTGTAVTITALGTVSAGIYKVIIYNAAHTLTHNATSLILVGGASRTVAAGDMSLVLSEGSGNWREILFTDVSEAITSYLAKAGGTMTGDITMTAASIIEAEGAAVASAATCNIWATDGNTLHITGTTTITSFGTAPQAGAWMKVIFDGALILTHGANLNLQGSANITTAANDWAFVYADTTTLFRVVYFKANGTAVVAATGKIVQVVEGTPYATYTSSAVAIPSDDTIPQNTEGVEINTVTITPTSATNRLRIEWDGTVGSGTSFSGVGIALFQDTTASAIAASHKQLYDSNESAGHYFSYEMAAGTTGATTFKIRFGPSSGTSYVNGNNAARKYGGILGCRLRVTEIAI